MIWLVDVGRYKKVIPSVDDISVVFSKTVCQPASSLPNVHYRWRLGARQAINHLFSDAGKMSRDVNMPFGCCNCGWWHGDMCGKRSCYKGKYLVIGVEGLEVGCFWWLADPSDSWHAGKSSVVVYYFIIYFICLSCCPREGSRNSLRLFSRQQGYWGGR